VIDRPDVQLIGRSDVIRTIKDDIDRAARSDARVLVTGETGVGKEVVARLIHRRSRRTLGPLVTLNCAGVPDSLLESELFGHVRGSFTGADRDRAGLLDQAPNGTLFLDEIGEMSPRMQAVLLRFLESGELQRVGADRPHACANVRLVAATNRNLPEQIAAGAFREDLHFRVNVVPMTLPPLRERSEDIPLFVDFFLRTHAAAHKVEPVAISPEGMAGLVAYRWPGNVRELRNVLERVLLMTRRPIVGADDLPVEVRDGDRTACAAASSATAGAHHLTAPTVAHAQQLAAAMLDDGESFWSAVHPQFMSRDLTRGALREVIQIGLVRTRGSYRQLIERFNMPSDDYKRFLQFLRTYDCCLPYRPFRDSPMFGRRLDGRAT
jgi:DNA-binding NtrC family response regulator